MNGKLIVLLFIIGTIYLSNGLPVKIFEENPEETAGYFEGDMNLEDKQKMEMLSRNGLINSSYHWPGGRVFYIINSDFDGEHINHILLGMKLIEEASCIRFYPASPVTKGFINITGFDGGCFSSVGFQNKSQQLNLAIAPVNTGCFRLGTVVHEMLHALGFYHQQSTYNRDDYVKIVFDNILEGKEHNFNKYESDTVEDFSITYDYGSVLHYGGQAFSKNGQDTIVPLQKDVEIGQRKRMSLKDIYKLNLMYKCPILT